MPLDSTFISYAPIPAASRARARRASGPSSRSALGDARATRSHARASHAPGRAPGHAGARARARRARGGHRRAARGSSPPGSSWRLVSGTTCTGTLVSADSAGARSSDPPTETPRLAHEAPAHAEHAGPSRSAPALQHQAPRATSVELDPHQRELDPHQVTQDAPGSLDTPPPWHRALCGPPAPPRPAQRCQRGPRASRPRRPLLHAPRGVGGELAGGRKRGQALPACEKYREVGQGTHARPSFPHAGEKVPYPPEKVPSSPEHPEPSARLPISSPPRPHPAPPPRKKARNPAPCFPEKREQSTPPTSLSGWQPKPKD